MQAPVYGPVRRDGFLLPNQQPSCKAGDLATNHVSLQQLQCYAGTQPVELRPPDYAPMAEGATAGGGGEYALM